MTFYEKLFLAGLNGVPDHVTDKQGAEGEQGDSEFGIVFLDDVLLSVGEVAQAGQYAVPDGSSQEGVNCKRNQLHVGDTCRNRNQLANNRNQSAYKSGNGAVFTEVVFGLLDFACV